MIHGAGKKLVVISS